MSIGYAITNALTGLAAASFTWSSAYAADRDNLNDGLQDELAASAASAQASGQTLSIDFGVASSLVGIAILNHNLATGSCTVAVTAADDSGFTTGVVTAKAATTINTAFPYSKDAVLQFPAVSKRYWRLTFTHTGTKIITIGELLAFAAITTLSRDAVYGASHSLRMVTNRTESRTGQMRSSFLAGPIRSMAFNFVDLQGTAERDELLALWNAALGDVRNVLLLDFVDSSSSAGSATSQQCLWGKLNATTGWTDDDFQLFGVSGFELVGQGREVGS